jgi:uncharacterized membrane protein SpoIIM required for sporulation
MTKARFMFSRRPAWERFHALLDKCDRARRSRLAGDEVTEFSRLFRAVCYDLATVRSRDWGRDLEQYLNDLVARGHNHFYRSPPGRPREVLQFLTEGFPRLLRQNMAYFWVSLLLFTVPGALCGLLVWHDPAWAGRVLPGEVLLTIEDMYSENRPHDEHGAMAAGMAGFYVHNNVGIAFRCFATGIFFGIGSAVALVFNSIFLGTITAYLVVQGHSDRFFSFVISHGSFELTAIVVAGAAGLILGHSLVHPGPFTRRQALLRRGLVGIKLAMGAGAMLGVAALIEAFWSPSGAPTLAKYIVGSMLWVLVILYLSLAGRGAHTE